jgi:hypothetical protein
MLMVTLKKIGFNEIVLPTYYFSSTEWANVKLYILICFFNKRPADKYLLRLFLLNMKQDK